MICDIFCSKKALNAAATPLCFLPLGHTTRKKTPDLTHYRAIDYGMTLAAARAAKNAGATEVHLISAIGADTQSKIFYSRLKGEIERDLLKMNFERTLIYQPSIKIGRFCAPTFILKSKRRTNSCISRPHQKQYPIAMKKPPREVALSY